MSTPHPPGPRRLAFFMALLLVPALCGAVSAPAPVHTQAPTAALAPLAPLAKLTDEAFVADLEQRTFQFFWDTADPVTGLVPDRYPSPSFASISAVGFGLTAYAIGVERGYVTRAQAAERVLKTLRFLERAPQNGTPTATGYKGFFYHFLDMRTGQRFKQVELSSIDTALLMAGAFTCQAYFDGGNAQEREIRTLVDQLNGRIDWNWMTVNPDQICMGWSPEAGFIKCDWQGYDEAMLLLVVAMGSPTHPAPAAVWPRFTRTYAWAAFEGQEHVNFGPLFGHQFSQIWIDFRGVQDAYMKGKGLDYAENTRRATYAQRAYAIRNPGQWQGYGPNLWGISACDGPADITLSVAGRQRAFQTYAARGVGVQGILDDGTLTPNAAAGSLPFTPEISIPALQEMRRRFGTHLYGTYGFTDSFNPTFPAGVRLQHGKHVAGLGWFDTDYLGIDQGLILGMVENYRSGLLWKLLRTHPVILRGMRQAGFTGGWMDAAGKAKVPTKTKTQTKTQTKAKTKTKTKTQVHP